MRSHALTVHTPGPLVHRKTVRLRDQLQPRVQTPTFLTQADIYRRNSLSPTRYGIPVIDGFESPHDVDSSDRLSRLNSFASP